MARPIRFGLTGETICRNGSIILYAMDIKYSTVLCYPWANFVAPLLYQFISKQSYAGHVLMYIVLSLIRGVAWVRVRASARLVVSDQARLQALIVSETFL